MKIGPLTTFRQSYLPAHRMVPALACALTCLGISFGIAYSNSVRGTRLAVLAAGPGALGLVVGYLLGKQCAAPQRPTPLSQPPAASEPERQVLKAAEPKQKPIPQTIPPLPKPKVESKPEASPKQLGAESIPPQLRPELGCRPIRELVVGQLIETFGTNIHGWDQDPIHQDENFIALMNNLKEISEEGQNEELEAIVFEWLFALRDSSRVQGETAQIVNAYLAVCCSGTLQGEVHQETLTELVTGLFNLAENVEQESSPDDCQAAQAMALSQPAAKAIYEELLNELLTKG
jgi:hypothetical protein